MTTRQILDILSRSHAELRERFGVSRIGLFGSWARGAQRIDSDIDLLVEFETPPGWEFFDLRDLLESRFGRRVDLVTRNGLRAELRDEILHDVVFP